MAPDELGEPGAVANSRPSDSGGDEEDLPNNLPNKNSTSVGSLDKTVFVKGQFAYCGDYCRLALFPNTVQDAIDFLFG